MADEDCQDETNLEQLKPHYKSINIKLVKCGGLTPAMQLISEAKKLDFKIMIGCMTESSCALMAAAQIAPLCDWADLDGAWLIQNNPFQTPLLQQGKIQLSNAAGLGLSN